MRIALLLSGLLLAGCATTVLTHDSKLEASQGVAVIRIVGNLEFPDWQSVWLRDEAGESWALFTAPTATRGSFVFAGALPPGRYVPYELRAHFYQGTQQTGSVT